MSAYGIIALCVLAVMSVVGFASMGIDKKKAQKKQWRTKEATLFLIAFLFGGVGSTLGMLCFRHKTQHWYFKLGMPLLAIVNIAAVVLIIILTKAA